ncbi:hypothetical protein PsorP6_010761 [Peronosclerospora sorghi]|uniref:Uncharacterized protein n=1 Tax=Peronosclerospora sorghi TaxID=230839 RepID=A0ACC0VV35_9STRA|nr:hypothetical protein PsorP6_010761 [Peronosclerospora sorghi]
MTLSRRSDHVPSKNWSSGTKPLRERVRLQRVATKLFTSIELVSNPFVPLVLDDYHVQWPERGHDASRLVVVETDPNTIVRGTRLCPNAEHQLAFTLATSQAFNQATYGTCHLIGATGWRGRRHVAPDDNGRPKLAGRSDGNTVLHRHWPRATYNAIFDTCVPDAVTFRLCVQEQMAQRGTALASDCYLWLEESSDEDWIVLGKTCERYVFAASTGTRSRAFTTRKLHVPALWLGLALEIV